MLHFGCISFSQLHYLVRKNLWLWTWKEMMWLHYTHLIYINLCVLFQYLMWGYNHNPCCKSLWSFIIWRRRKCSLSNIPFFMKVHVQCFHIWLCAMDFLLENLDKTFVHYMNIYCWTCWKLHHPLFAEW